jgi:hypothetical protein
LRDILVARGAIAGTSLIPSGLVLAAGDRRRIFTGITSEVWDGTGHRREFSHWADYLAVAIVWTFGGKKS